MTLQGRHEVTMDDVVQTVVELTRLSDVVELFDALTEQCARLLDVRACGLMLADRSGLLHLMSSTSSRTRQLQLSQLQRGEGPCLDCYRSGRAFLTPHLRVMTSRWPACTARPPPWGFVSVYAVPMRVDGVTIGTLGLVGAGPRRRGKESNLGHALAANAACKDPAMRPAGASATVAEPGAARPMKGSRGELTVGLLRGQPDTVRSSGEWPPHCGSRSSGSGPGRHGGRQQPPAAQPTRSAAGTGRTTVPASGVCAMEAGFRRGRGCGGGGRLSEGSRLHGGADGQVTDLDVVRLLNREGDGAGDGFGRQTEPGHAVADLLP